MEKIERNTRQSFQGVVVSDKMEKTIVVLVETYKTHKKYGKRVKYAKKYVAHDETNSAHVGDTVTIRGSRPLSKTKRFVLVRIDKLAPTPIKKAVEDINEEIDETLEVVAPVEEPVVVEEVKAEVEVAPQEEVAAPVVEEPAPKKKVVRKKKDEEAE